MWVGRQKPSARDAKWLTLLLLGCAGCGEFQRENTAAEFDGALCGHRDGVAAIWFKTSYLHPGRDYLTFDWLRRGIGGDEAWNVASDGGVPDGPFFTNRNIVQVAPGSLRAFASESEPVGPWRLRKAKAAGKTPGFIGEDSLGRAYLVKLDHEDYPELGTSAEVIGARVVWLLGYHTLPVYLVRVEGTGDHRFDGRRAAATPFLEHGVVGGFKYDHFRMRREVRALRLAAAWLNDVDRVDNNTLVAIQDNRAICYQIDFNSSLGSWNGRPKEPWRGRRYAWDVEWQVVGFLTLGLFPSASPSGEVDSPSTGRLAPPFGEARNWRGQNPNTAFDRLTQADAQWMARRLALISEAQLGEIVAAAEFGDPADADRVREWLRERRRWVLRSWGLEDLLSIGGHG